MDLTFHLVTFGNKEFKNFGGCKATLESGIILYRLWGTSIRLWIIKNSDDTNIQLLVKLMETVDETFESIKNINNIKLDEE